MSSGQVLAAIVSIGGDTSKYPPLPKSSRSEIHFRQLLAGALSGICTVVPQFQVKKFRVDFYIPEFNIPIEYDEPHHSKSKKQDAIRQRDIESELKSSMIRVKRGHEVKGVNEVLRRIMDK